MIRLDAATVLLQWSVGGLFFLWITGRHRLVGIGYGWLLRATYGFTAIGSVVAGFRYDPVPARDLLAAGVAAACAAGLWVSWVRRRAGVLHQREAAERRNARVVEMTGIDRDEQSFDATVPEFPPALDLVGPAIGLLGLVAAGVHAADGAGSAAILLSVARTVAGAGFLGCVSDAMLLGHWYLVQPGLPRRPLLELVRWLAIIWPFEVAFLLLPTGMFSVFSGRIDDGYGGMLGWFWAACAITTIVLTGVTRAALRERQYAAVMAATGLLYLAILTGFGTDLVARALLAG